MSRDAILGRIRTSLRRSPETPVAAGPAPMLQLPDTGVEERIAQFTKALEALSGSAHRAPSAAAARALVSELIGTGGAIASNAPFLTEVGVTSLEGVQSGLTDAPRLRELCASLPAGITSADYALADTGTLVLLSSRAEARLVSLLPPIHIAVIPSASILSGLDELLSLVPKPADLTSSMVFITGPSRTADIEQILIRGVHGPGQVHVIIV